MVAAGVVTVVTGLLYLTIPLHARSESIDIKVEGKALVTSIRDIVARAKEGSSLVADVGDLEGLQNAVFNLIAGLPNQEISECETQTVIKLATAAVGSHEILGVLLAGSDVEIQSSRIGLSFAFLDCAAQLLDDKLARSSDVGPELFAISFGANTTIDIIKTSDATIREKMALVEQRNRSRRDVVPFLGRGFYFSNHVACWQDTIGSHTFHVGNSGPPVFLGGWRHVKRRSPQWTGGLSSSGDLGSGRVNGNVGWSSRDGRNSAGVGAGVAWGPSGFQPSVNANLGLTSRDGRISAGVNGGVTWGQGGAQPSLNGNVGLTSRDGRVSAGVSGGFAWGQGGPNPNFGVTVGLKF